MIRMTPLTRSFRPLFDRVLVRKLQVDATTKSGIYIPESSKGPANKGMVVAVGPGRTHKGHLQPVAVSIGDVVVVPEYGGMTLNVDGEDLHVFRDEDIIGIMGDK
eukprot:GHVR01110261.1.p1 GENE.GHVR01110261.1~~GHVR01110261.1.p1  ORF type:complete len:105 (+),score=14.67 GHVR01110261.1:88-402(+)